MSSVSGLRDREPALEAAPDSATGFGLYVHWPFCLSKCPYCDFNSHVRERIDQKRWCQALLRELDHFGTLTTGRRLTSVFFGGGTPSLMAPDTVAAVIEALSNYWSLDPDIEITLEANPTSSEAGRFAGYRDVGVNRLSLGVQALDDQALAALGRQHSVAEALAAVDLARRSFERYSFDLIYTRPGQSAAAWREELKTALAEAPSHLSLYQLTIEPNTVFHGAWRRGELTLPDSETTAQVYEETQEILTTAGLPAYEISNHALPGAACRHNLTYWRYEDYVGIGPGAHGRLTAKGEKRATRQHRAPEAWLEAVERRGHATREDTPLTASDRLAEMTMMGLRLTEGIGRDAFRRELGQFPEVLYERGRVAALERAGYLVLDEEGLRATDAGRLRLNALLDHLLN